MRGHVKRVALYARSCEEGGSRVEGQLGDCIVSALCVRSCEEGHVWKVSWEVVSSQRCV